GKQSVGKQNGEKRPAARAAAAAQEPGHPTVELARQLAAIVETHALTELVMDTPDLTLTFRRGQESGVWGGATVATSVPAAMPMARPARPPAPAARPEAEAAPAAPAAAPAEAEFHVVTSPFVGTFYRAPSPDSDPYVTEGQRVEKGQVLCIV